MQCFAEHHLHSPTPRFSCIPPRMGDEGGWAPSTIKPPTSLPCTGSSNRVTTPHCDQKVTKSQVFAHCWSRGGKTCPALGAPHTTRSKSFAFLVQTNTKQHFVDAPLQHWTRRNNAKLLMLFLQNPRFFLRDLQPAELPAQI